VTASKPLGPPAGAPASGQRPKATGSQRLAAALHRLKPDVGPGPAPTWDLKPSNAFEVAVAERLKAMQCQIDQLTSRLNWLLTVIIGAALTNLVIALLK
jgi:hypothetical protein